ncbi:MAG: type II secretion system GspH family protein [Candidatus Berkelbacteria bacterium]|nr:type II secretion system GspH family protein [Candidatus Berkelbacteria bacterium]
MKRGFTLIEALAVVSIIGILAATATYVFVSATSRSRDARRKSDLTAISLGFQARHDALACSNETDKGRYPGYKLDNWSSGEQRWKDVARLSGTNDPCGAFSEYLITIPTDPRSGNGGLVYRFDLSIENGVIGRHYRLTAKLEKVITPNSPEDLALVRAVEVWQTSFGGAALPEDYNYIIGN